MGNHIGRYIPPHHRSPYSPLTPLDPPMPFALTLNYYNRPLDATVTLDDQDGPLVASLGLSWHLHMSKVSPLRVRSYPKWKDWPRDQPLWLHKLVPVLSTTDAPEALQLAVNDQPKMLLGLLSTIGRVTMLRSQSLDYRRPFILCERIVVRYPSVLTFEGPSNENLLDARQEQRQSHM